MNYDDLASLKIGDAVTHIDREIPVYTIVNFVHTVGRSGFKAVAIRTIRFPQDWIKEERQVGDVRQFVVGDVVEHDKMRGVQWVVGSALGVCVTVVTIGSCEDPSLWKRA